MKNKISNKDIKKLLKNRAQKVCVKDFSQEILQSVNHPQKRVKKESGFCKKWVYQTIALAACLCIFVSVVFVVNKNSSIPDNSQTVSAKTKNVFTKEVLALGNMMSDISSSSDFVKYVSYSSYKGKTDFPVKFFYNKGFTNEDYQKNAKEINNYLFTLDAFMSNSRINSSFSENSDSEYSKYAYKFTVSYEDFHSYNINYSVYYNESEHTAEKIEIEGIIIIEENEFKIEGERSCDGEEIEMELSIFTGPDSYITVSNETEINENEYEYEFYEANILKKGVSMEVSVEEGVKESEIEITENGKVYKCEFEYLDDVIKCEYTSKTDSEKIEYEILIHQDERYYIYLFEDGFEIKLPKTKDK